jgi:hypothetical protein
VGVPERAPGLARGIDRGGDITEADLFYPFFYSFKDKNDLGGGRSSGSLPTTT